MTDKIVYEGISWSVGTTSFRTKELNKKIEWQLDLLNQFWNKSDNKNVSWAANEILQQKYYKHLWENDFIFGNASRPAKDAREKTSGLCDIGLVDRKTRKLTEIGNELLNITKTKNFKNDNLLQIASDSFLYLKQLLKTSLNIDSLTVRPFVVLARILNDLDFLTEDEFTYFVPLICDEISYSIVLSKIKDHRKNKCDINQTIYEIFMSHKSYKQAYEMFMNANIISEDLIVTIMMNRKSPIYSKPFFPLYKALYKVLVQKDFSVKSMAELEKTISDCKTTKTIIRRQLYATTKNIIKGGEKTFNRSVIDAVIDERTFKELFFKICHLAKTLNNLEDYGDLNLRYFKMTDCLVTNEKIEFDILPKVYFNIVNETLKELSFSDCNLLYKSCDLKEISNGLEINSELFYNKIAEKIGSSIYDKKSIQSILDREKYNRFKKLIYEKFTNEKLIQILEYFKKRKTSNDEYDNLIKDFVSSNADGPTLFEYILGIIWYKISDYEGDVLSYMNLSLDADLLPKTHAGGGVADIVWQYDKTTSYPKHDLLIEATLSDSTNQRRMEMEPVSRHLGDYILSHKNYESYCVFISNYLHINVISDFRGRKTNTYYNSDGTDKIDGMMIIPLESDVLITLLKLDKKYAELYKDFHEADKLISAPKQWYNAFIQRLGIMN